MKKTLKKYFGRKNYKEKLENYCVDCQTTLYNEISIEIFGKEIVLFITWFKYVFMNKVYRCKTCSFNFKHRIHQNKLR